MSRFSVPGPDPATLVLESSANTPSFLRSDSRSGEYPSAKSITRSSHDGDVAAIEAKPGADDAAPCTLQDGVVDDRVFENHLGALWPSHVTRFDLDAIDIDTVGGRHTHRFAIRLHDGCNHARGGRLAVRARDGDNGDPGRRAGREEHVNHGTTRLAGQALCRVRVHAESRCRIDFHDSAADFADGARDVWADEIDPGDIEAQRLGCLARHRIVVGVDLVSTVDHGAARAHVAGLLELDELTAHGDVIQAQALVLKEIVCLAVDGDPSQWFLMTDAAPGIGIGNVDQLTDRPVAVSDDVGGQALSDGDDAVIDDQNPVVLADEVALDDDVAGPALCNREGEGLPHSVGALDLGGNPPAVVAIERFEDDGKADTTGHPSCFFGRPHDLTSG